MVLAVVEVAVEAMTNPGDDELTAPVAEIRITARKKTRAGKAKGKGLRMGIGTAKENATVGIAGGKGVPKGKEVGIAAGDVAGIAKRKRITKMNGNRAETPKGEGIALVVKVSRRRHRVTVPTETARENGNRVGTRAVVVTPSATVTVMVMVIEVGGLGKETADRPGTIPTNGMDVLATTVPKNGTHILGGKTIEVTGDPGGGVAATAVVEVSGTGVALLTETSAGALARGKSDAVETGVVMALAVVVVVGAETDTARTIMLDLDMAVTEVMEDEVGLTLGGKEA